MFALEISAVFFLIVVNGLLAMSEMAIVSSRTSRLKAMVDQDVVGARRALALASDPGRFLSAVQIGITLVGVLSGAFSGATLGQRFSVWLMAQGLSQRCGGRGRRRRGGGDHHLCLADRGRAGAQADRAARSRSGGGAGGARHGVGRADLTSPLVWLLDASGRLVLTVLRPEQCARENASPRKKSRP